MPGPHRTGASQPCRLGDAERGEKPYQRGDRRLGAAPGEVITVEVEESRSRVHGTSFACLTGRLRVK
jgi:hypothetical protein